MPTVGSFHRIFWGTQRNPVNPASRSSAWMYPGVQSVVTMGMAIWGVPLAVVRPIWDQLRWSGRLVKHLWWVRAPDAQGRVEQWIARLEAFTPQELTVLERVVATLTGPYWADAQARVAACATTPKFHQPDQWVQYSRAIKRDIGQAQNVFRHVRVVHELRDAHAELPNPDAHLVTELAYQARALEGRPNRRVIAHAHV